MPRLPFTCRINGGDLKSLASLSLALQSLDLRNMEADIAALTWTRKNGQQTCPIAHDATVELFLGERRLFYGRARIGAVNWQGAPVQILGPWVDLETRTWNVGLDGGLGPRLGMTATSSFVGVQYFNGTAWVDMPASVTWTYGTVNAYTYPSTTGTVDTNQYLTSRLWLFAPINGNTDYKTVAAQLNELLSNLLHVGEPDPVIIGSLSLGGNAAPKLRTVQDISLAEAVKQTLAVKPDAALWFDYSAVSGVPTLNAKVASLEAAQTLQIGHLAGQMLPDYSLKVLDDMIPAGVVIRWEGDASEFTGLGRPYLVDKYPAGIVSYSPRVLVQTITEDIPRVPGLAQEMYASLAVRRTTGTLSVLDLDFSAGFRPGRVYTVDGDAHLSGVQNLVQGVRWAPETGLVSCTVGYPEHLCLRDRLDLKGWLRRVFYVPGGVVAQIIPPPA